MRKLRIGVLVEPRDLFAWERAMLARIAGSNYAEVVLVVHCASPLDCRPPARPSRITSLFARLVRRLAYAIQSKLEEKVGGYHPDAMAVAKDLEPLCGIPRIYTSTRSTDPPPASVSLDIASLQAHAIDVFICLDSFGLNGDVVRTAKHGVWTLCQVPYHISGGNPAGFWEVLARRPVTETVLVASRGTPVSEVIISRTSSATCVVSVRRNRNLLYWKASLLLPRKLQELHLMGPDIALRNAAESGPQSSMPESVSPSTPLPLPRLSDEVACVAKIAWRVYSTRIRNLLVSSQWILLYAVRNEIPTSSFEFKRIVPPNDRIWADPHIQLNGGKYYVFIEELLLHRGKGHISVMQIEESGKHTAPRMVLEKSYHLSHPFVFEHDGQAFLIPESAQNRSVDLYRCVSFPDQWEHCETLLKDVHAVDSTMHFHHGRWWLFTNIREVACGSSDDDLFLFSSDSLLGGYWQPHPRNPIVSDVTRARPAGPIIAHAGKLYRPAQDCSIRYGYGIRINEILHLSESDYVEREVAFIEPRHSEHISGMHTITRAENLWLSDALENQWALLASLRGRRS